MSQPDSVELLAAELRRSCEDGEHWTPVPVPEHPGRWSIGCGCHVADRIAALFAAERERYAKLEANRDAQLKWNDELAEKLEATMMEHCKIHEDDRALLIREAQEKIAKLEAEIATVVAEMRGLDPGPMNPDESAHYVPVAVLLEFAARLAALAIMTEPTPKPTDALEELKQARAGLIDECSCVASQACVPWDWWGLFDRAIAAWEKERAEHELRRGALMRSAELNGEKTGELIALRAALERIEGEMRETANLNPAATDVGNLLCFFEEFADALRAAREGGKYGQT